MFGFRVLLCCLLLSACGAEPSGRAAPASPAPLSAAATAMPAPAAAPGIQWFDGAVSEAFALAQARNKPVFLYWGAVWCPPCNQIKSTVFSDPAFIAQTGEFVAVYLDGDSEDAQRWGEHFGAMGYPTLIVFSPSGEELTRLSSGEPPSHYRQVLDQVLAGQRSVASLLSVALQAPGTLTASDWQALAAYSWEADQGRALGQRDAIETYDALAASCPQQALALRFALLADVQRLNQQQAASEALFARLDTLLNDAELWRANLAVLQYEGGALVRAATGPATYQRSRIGKLYQAAMEAAWMDDSLPLKVRFASHYGLLDLFQDDAEARQRFALQLKQRIAALEQRVLSPQERQSIIPGAAWLLHKAGDSDTARGVFINYMRDAIAPYYTMAYLASMEKDLGNDAAALDWSRQAFEAAQGPATRIQWGLSYLKHLLDLAPEQSQTIGRVLRAVFEQLAAQPGSFYQRSRVRLERQLPVLQAWVDTPEHRQALAQAGPAILAACAALPAQAPSASLCAGYQALLPASG